VATADPDTQVVPDALVWATDIDVLPRSRLVARRDGYLVVRSPENPLHYWGNFLIFDAPPGDGDGVRWEACFEREFGEEPRVAHRTFAWEGIDGELGAARGEFLDRSYGLEKTVGLVADPGQVHAHPRENREVQVRTLDPSGGAGQELWEQVIEIWVAARTEADSEPLHREFSIRRLGELRELFTAGAGAWYVALDPDGTEVLASCGIVVTGGRGRFQAVDTLAAHRRRGICSRLVVDACRHSVREFASRRFVIAADPDYHALGLYESLGFQPAERVAGVCLRPPADS
jgi:ribosomal protein S18 acetylase RimI-like enzyme